MEGSEEGSERKSKKRKKEKKKSQIHTQEMRWSSYKIVKLKVTSN